MTLEEFRQSVKTDEAPPSGLSPLLQALWHDARGDWDRAHQLAQDVDTKAGAWVHAYLHRKEGDESNAGYWYRRAAREMSRGALDDEWEDIVDALLKGQD
jgi:hypothetical protein